MKAKRNNLEAQMQQEFFAKLPLFVRNEADRRLIFAVPNGGSRHPLEAANLKRQGVKAGVPDVICLFPKYLFVLCIEFKTAKGKQTPEQKAFQEACESKGCKYVVCRSANEALKAICNHLSIKNNL